MSLKVKRCEGGIVVFMCPGCNEPHQVRVEGPHAWGWNGSLESPTPSVKVSGFQPTTDEEVDRIMKGEKVERRPLCCHSFVTDGKIQFLDDCTHTLRGAHEIPDWRERGG